MWCAEESQEVRNFPCCLPLLPFRIFLFYYTSLSRTHLFSEDTAATMFWFIFVELPIISTPSKFTHDTVYVNFTAMKYQLIRYQDSAIWAWYIDITSKSTQKKANQNFNATSSALAALWDSAPWMVSAIIYYSLIGKHLNTTTQAAVIKSPDRERCSLHFFSWPSISASF